jgi:hypothetical protein
MDKIQKNNVKMEWNFTKYYKKFIQQWQLLTCMKYQWKKKFSNQQQQSMDKVKNIIFFHECMVKEYPHYFTI